MEDWKYFRDLTEEDLENPVSINVDTRDFCAFIAKSFYCEGKLKTALRIANNFIKNNPFRAKYYSFYSIDDIIEWLKKLEDMTGGFGEWRCINLKRGYNEVSGWDLKYIRFFYNETLHVWYAVSDSHSLLDKRLFFKDNIDEENLCHQN